MKKLITILAITLSLSAFAQKECPKECQNIEVKTEMIITYFDNCRVVSHTGYKIQTAYKGKVLNRYFVYSCGDIKEVEIINLFNRYYK